MKFRKASPLMPSSSAAQSRQRYGGFDDRPVLLPLHLGPVFADGFVVVEELEEENPSKHRQAVEVAVEPLVLPHDVAGGLDEAAEPLGGGKGLSVGF